MEKSQSQYNPDNQYDGFSPNSAAPYAARARRNRALSRLTLGVAVVALLIVSGAFLAVPGPSLLPCHKWMGLGRRSDSGSGVVVGQGAKSTGTEEGLENHPEDRLSNRKVPLEAHIMSKCPDAQACLQQLVVPAMEQISDKVDFGLSFIANVSSSSSEIKCKHGPEECVGNMLILCAANLPFPPDGSGDGEKTPTIRSLGFANCLIGEYEEIPGRALVEKCAAQHGIDFDALNRCASNQDDDPNDPDKLSGLALLRKSALRSAKLKASISCTVRLNEAVWCVRDGGVWKDCAKGGKASEVSVLVEEVKRLYDEEN